MLLELMRFQIHLSRKDDKLLLLALAIQAHKMVLAEVLLQRLVVDIVMWVSAVLSIAKEAPLVLLSAMDVQLIITIEALSAETTQRMSLKTTLINRTRIIISFRHMFLQLLVGEESKLMSEDLLVPRAEIAHLLMVHRFNMAMQIWPSTSCHIASRFWTVVV